MWKSFHFNRSKALKVTFIENGPEPEAEPVLWSGSWFLTVDLKVEQLEQEVEVAPQVF